MYLIFTFKTEINLCNYHLSFISYFQMTSYYNSGITYVQAVISSYFCDRGYLTEISVIMMIRRKRMLLNRAGKT